MSRTNSTPCAHALAGSAQEEPGRDVHGEAREALPTQKKRVDAPRKESLAVSSEPVTPAPALAQEPMLCEHQEGMEAAS